ncbi:MAG: hypothetical protein GKR93_04105 [Gammaproteobacteria bacterium]|nr:hypothetical protein [Gammaproteobacteria bacterium]
MKNSGHLSLIISSIIILSTLSGPASARIKCWKNHEGIRECGEKVPPEFAQKGHSELGSHGVVVDKKERVKTEEELAEQARQAALAAKQKEVEAEKARQDRILLDTFTSVADIEAARDDKVAVIESAITLTNKRNEKTQEDLDKRIQAAAAAERAGNTPNDDLLKDIEVLRGRIENNKVFIQERRKEQEIVKADADVDINRFKNLKGL